MVGCQRAGSMWTDHVLDALEQTVYARSADNGVIHHSDCGAQNLSICYTERLRGATIEGSVGTNGDSCINTLTKSIIGLYKVELIHRRGPGCSLDDVAYATLEWVDWSDHRHLLEPLAHLAPLGLEQAY